MSLPATPLDDQISGAEVRDLMDRSKFRGMNGAEILEYLEKEGVLGSRPDIEDAQVEARRIRRQAERRVWQADLSA